MLSLLTALCSALARRRHLLADSLALSTKLIDFCATQLQNSGKATATQSLFSRKLLAKLLLVALTQVRFPLNYR